MRSRSMPSSRAVTPSGLERRHHDSGHHLDADALRLNEALALSRSSSADTPPSSALQSRLQQPPLPQELNALRKGLGAMDDGLSQLGRRSEADTQSVELFANGVDPLDLDNPSLSLFYRDEAHDGEDAESDDSRGTISRKGEGSRPSSRAASAPGRLGLKRALVASAPLTGGRGRGILMKAQYSEEDERLLRSLQQKPTCLASSSTTNEDVSQQQAASSNDEVSCRCSQCSTPFEADSLRYVCDSCGPRRSSISTSSHRTSSTASPTRGEAQSVPLVEALDGWSDADSSVHRTPTGPEGFAGAQEGEGILDDLSSAWSASEAESPAEIEDAHRNGRSEASSSEGGRRSSSSSSQTAVEGYELCLACVGDHGAKHVSENSVAEAKKHAFFELVYQDGRWKAIGEKFSISLMCNCF